MKKIFAKFLIITSLTFTAVGSLFAISAEEAEINRIAATLAKEIGNYKDESQVWHVGAMIRYYFDVGRKRDKRINFSDIVYGKFGGTGADLYSYSRQSFARKDPAKLQQATGLNNARWAVMIKVATAVREGSSLYRRKEYQETVGAGATGYVSSIIRKKREYKNSPYKKVYEEKQSGPHHIFYYGYLGKKPFVHDPTLYAPIGAAEYEDIDVPEINAEAINEDDNAAARAEACNLEHMQEIYMGDGEDSEDKYCWYCKIVIVLTNSYLQAAKDALGASIDLGKLILKLGFAIWLAYYILQQVSAMTPTTPGKMLQEILIMGFKVALAYVCVDNGLVIIRDYFINPIVGLGVDYGTALLDPIINVNG